MKNFMKWKDTPYMMASCINEGLFQNKHLVMVIGNLMFRFTFLHNLPRPLRGMKPVKPSAVSPDSSVISPDLSVIARNSLVVSPEPSVVSPSPSAVSRNLSVVSPDLSVVSPDSLVVSRSLSVVSPQL